MRIDWLLWAFVGFYGHSRASGERGALRQPTILPPRYAAKGAAAGCCYGCEAKKQSNSLAFIGFCLHLSACGAPRSSDSAIPVSGEQSKKELKHN
ncbi:MAG: hypothetical protein WD767_19050 [Alphaproteobacteria bacterium]